MKNILLFFSGFVFGEAMGIWRAEFAVFFAIPGLITIGCLAFILALISDKSRQKRDAKAWFDSRKGRMML